MQVIELAESLGVTPDTVRYYTRTGLLQPVKNPDNGYKEYSQKDQSRLRFIASARQLGFSVKDITQILGEADKGKSPCALSRELLEKRLKETEQRFQEMVALRQRMQAAVDAWQSKPNKEPNGEMICHLIEEFEG
ncbi:MAG: MerR family transcriptional regulator [Pseudomonadota bacterium]